MATFTQEAPKETTRMHAIDTKDPIFVMRKKMKRDKYAVPGVQCMYAASGNDRQRSSPTREQMLRKILPEALAISALLTPRSPTMNQCQPMSPPPTPGRHHEVAKNDRGEFPTMLPLCNSEFDNHVLGNHEQCCQFSTKGSPKKRAGSSTTAMHFHLEPRSPLPIPHRDTLPAISSRSHVSHKRQECDDLPYAPFIWEADEEPTEKHESTSGVIPLKTHDDKVSKMLDNLSQHTKGLSIKGNRRSGRASLNARCA